MCGWVEISLVGRERRIKFENNLVGLSLSAGSATFHDVSLGAHLIAQGGELAGTGKHSCVAPITTTPLDGVTAHCIVSSSQQCKQINNPRFRPVISALLVHKRNTHVTSSYGNGSQKHCMFLPIGLPCVLPAMTCRMQQSFELAALHFPPLKCSRISLGPHYLYVICVVLMTYTPRRTGSLVSC